MSAIPDRYRGERDREGVALCLLADVLDPPAPEEAATNPPGWREAVARWQAVERAMRAQHPEVGHR